MVNELYHHGIKGMRWGVRRYQNADGTLTPAGQKRRAKEIDKQLGRLQQDNARLEAQYHNAVGGTRRSFNQFNKYRTKYSKKVRRTYDSDYATRTIYDRTRVRYASDKERRKNKKRRTEWKDSELQRVQYYYI